MTPEARVPRGPGRKFGFGPPPGPGRGGPGCVVGLCLLGAFATAVVLLTALL